LNKYSDRDLTPAVIFVGIMVIVWIAILAGWIAI
jgi:hypothetical protein